MDHTWFRHDIFPFEYEIKLNYPEYPNKKSLQSTDAIGITHCFIEQDGKAYYGFSICSAKDIFSKSKGRNIAVHRAMAMILNEKNMQSISKDDITNKKTHKQYHNICDNIVEFVRIRMTKRNMKIMFVDLQNYDEAFGDLNDKILQGD